LNDSIRLIIIRLFDGFSHALKVFLLLIFSVRALETTPLLVNPVAYHHYFGGGELGGWGGGGRWGGGGDTNKSHSFKLLEHCVEIIVKKMSSLKATEYDPVLRDRHCISAIEERHLH
jgi:hypothetical protein